MRFVFDLKRADNLNYKKCNFIFYNLKSWVLFINKNINSPGRERKRERDKINK